MTKICVICGKEYECSKDSRGKTCSIPCRSELIKQTTFKNHGVLNISQKESVKKAKEEKALKKYGFKNVFQAPEIKEKLKQTNIEKYGAPNPSQSAECQAKRSETFEKKYNGHPFQNEEVKAKIKETHLKRRNCINPMFKNIKNFDDYNKDGILRVFDIPNNYVSFELRMKMCNYFNVTESPMREKLKRLGFEVELSSMVSSYEFKLRDKLKELVKSEIIYNSRNLIKSPDGNKLELDIYIPDMNIAIEFNGSYWHDGSEYLDGLTKEEYKTKECEKLGITLHHIWDYENMDTRLAEIFQINNQKSHKKD